MIFLTGNQLKILRNADNKSKKDIVNEFVNETKAQNSISDLDYMNNVKHNMTLNAYL